jgi:hypothetical protein
MGGGWTRWLGAVAAWHQQSLHVSRVGAHTISLRSCVSLVRLRARTYSPQLRDMGLSGVWFALLEGVPIASGTTRQEVEQAVKRIVPKHKLPFIYTFQVKGAAHRRGAKRSEAP